MRKLIVFIILSMLIGVAIGATVGGGDKQNTSQISYFYDKSGELANGVPGWGTSKDGNYIFSTPTRSIWRGPSDPPDVIWLQVGDNPGEFYYPELEDEEWLTE